MIPPVQQLCSLGEGEHSTRIEQDLDSLLLDNPQFAFGSAGREDLVAVLSVRSSMSSRSLYLVDPQVRFTGFLSFRSTTRLLSWTRQRRRSSTHSNASGRVFLHARLARQELRFPTVLPSWSRRTPTRDNRVLVLAQHGRT